MSNLSRPQISHCPGVKVWRMESKNPASSTLLGGYNLRGLSLCCEELSSDLFSVWFGNSSKTIIDQGVDSSNGRKTIAVVPDFHKRILFSDEAPFWLNGYVNKQNCRIWREANLQVYVETPLHPEKLTVCALYGLVESFFKNDEGHNVTAMVIGTEP
ncbi:hypothetical protein TNCV_2043891 [Trichonephila clavipes]|nr:hypothetical protein TNCV_2043891 [Trichonephila clavipes]